MRSCRESCQAQMASYSCPTQQKLRPSHTWSNFVTPLAGCGARVAVGGEQTPLEANALEGKRMTAEPLG